jgi:LL-diaminopimelate aminotransferase
MRVADRIDDLPPYVFAALGRRIRELNAQGKDIIRLDIGSPDLPPPDYVVEAMYHSARDVDHHGYGGFAGTPELRSAMAGYYERRFGVELDPDSEVTPLIGSKEGIANAALAFVDPGDLVLVPDPGYPTYRMGTILAGGVPIRVPLTEGNGYLPELESIPVETARAARVLWLSYPNNPTGAIAPLSFLARVVDFARENELLVCHDNPYCDVTFEGYVAPSMLQVPGAKEVVLEFNSLSKTYNMAGWRVGMAVGNPTAVEALGRTKSHIDSGIFRAVQDAAIVALNGDQTWLEERNEVYRKRRDLIVDSLREVGIEADVPRASLYVWAKTPSGYTSEQFTTWLLEDIGISITPGTVYGECGKGYLRISLGRSTERIEEAMERLERALQTET